MAVCSKAALEIGAMEILDSLIAEDVSMSDARAIRRGWAVRDEGNVLVSRYATYHGNRDRFTSPMAFEAAVNGRAIPDFDLTNLDGAERRQVLLRRGLALAWSALYVQSHDVPDVTMIGEVSLAPTLFDPDLWTGNVTFYTLADHELESGAGVEIYLQTSDCQAPLPPSTAWGALVRRVCGAAIR